MKKFKTNELLSRAEMKSVSGSSYGCGGVCQTIYYIDTNETVVRMCEHNWTKGCGCSGTDGYWIPCN